MADPSELVALMPFAVHLGIVVDSARPEEVIGRLPYRPELDTGAESVHGGALMSLADSLGAVCAFLHLADGQRTATTSSHTHFLRAARGTVTGRTRPLHVGRSALVVQTDLSDESGRLVTQTTQSQAIIAAP